MAIFLWVGSIMSKRELDKTIVFIYCSLVFIICIITLKCFGVNIPALNYGFKVHMKDIPLYLVLSISGSCIIFLTSSIIVKNKLFEWFGKNSLIIYIVHVPFLNLFYTMYSKFIHVNVLLAVTIYITTLFSSVLVAILLNTRRLKFIIGKF